MESVKHVLSLRKEIKKDICCSLGNVVGLCEGFILTTSPKVISNPSRLLGGVVQGFRKVPTTR